MTRQCRHKPKTTRLYRPPWGGTFVGPDYSGWHVDAGYCEFGNCLEYACPVCGCIGAGVGPIGCPCDDGVGYREMRRKRPVAVKPSVAGRSHVSRSRSRSRHR